MRGELYDASGFSAVSAARARLERLVVVLELPWKQIAFGVAGALGLSAGFNEFDGD